MSGDTAHAIVHYTSDGEMLFWCGIRGIGNQWSTRKQDAILFARSIDAERCAHTLPSPSGLAIAVDL